MLHQESAQHRPPETGHVEARHELGSEQEGESVDHQIEEPESQDRDRQGQDGQNRSDQRVDQPQHDGGDGQGLGRVDM